MTNSKDVLLETLTYCVTSAAGLPSEPKYYGEIRLMEVSERISRILAAENPEYNKLEAFANYINSNKGLSMTDVQAFEKFVQDAVIKLLDSI